MSCYITALGTVTFGEYGFSAQTAIGLILSVGLVLYLIKRVVANFLKKLPVSGCNSPEPLLPNHKSIKYISTSSQRSWAHPVPTFSRKIPLSWHTRASQMAQCKESTCQCRRHKRLRFNPWVGKIPWRRVWQPTPVLLPGKSHGQRSLADYTSQDHRESDTTG